MEEVMFPAGLKHYDHLRFCGSDWYGNTNLMLTEGAMPLVIGSGSKPQVWMQRFDYESKKTLPVVEASIPLHPAVTVGEEDGELVFRVGDTPLLIMRQFDERSAEVRLVNLQPLGFDVVGDDKSLRIANMHIANSKMTDVRFIAIFGDPPAA